MDHSCAYLQEWSGRRPNLLADVLVNILLTGVGAPVIEEFFVKNVLLVQSHKDLGNVGREFRVSYADVAFETPQEGLLRLISLIELEIISCQTQIVSTIHSRDLQP